MGWIRVHTFHTSSKMTALAPSTRAFPMRSRSGSKAAESHSTTLPVQKKRMIRGERAKEQNMIVMRRFS